MYDPGIRNHFAVRVRREVVNTKKPLSGYSGDLIPTGIKFAPILTKYRI